MTESNKISFKCPGCGKSFRANPEAVGKKVHCPDKQCGARLIVVPDRQRESGRQGNDDSRREAQILTVACGKCPARFQVKTHQPEKIVECPKCHTKVTVSTTGQ